MRSVLAFQHPPIAHFSKSAFDTPHADYSNECINPPFPIFVDFFVGSGLVTQGTKHTCTPVWSNDICGILFPMAVSIVLSDAP